MINLANGFIDKHDIKFGEKIITMVIKEDINE
jgi:hypothetical protein